VEEIDTMAEARKLAVVQESVEDVVMQVSISIGS
jgi:hypothetical protein